MGLKGAPSTFKIKIKEKENLNDIHGSGNEVIFILVWETTILQVKWLEQRSLKTGCSCALNSAKTGVAQWYQAHYIGFVKKAAENTCSIKIEE